MNRSFFSVLAIAGVTVYLIAVAGLGWITTQGSINLLWGGVNHYPQSAIFLPKQTVAVVSLLTNPRKLNAWRQVNLPLTKHKTNRQKWQEWSTDLSAKIGFDYQRDIKPWLGDEITFAIVSLDYDRDAANGVQPGYILAMETRNTNLAREHLQNFYGDRDNISVEQYKGTNIIFPDADSMWSSVVAGNFVLFANHHQILKQAINQAQAVDLNIEHSDDYRTALNNIQQPHIAIGYVDVLGLSAWLDKSILSTLNDRRRLSAALSTKNSNLAAEIELRNPSTGISKSFLDNPELQQIFNTLELDRHKSAYIDLEDETLLKDRIPLYKVTKLAIKSWFPQLKGISIHNLDEQNISRTDILFELNNY